MLRDGLDRVTTRYLCAGFVVEHGLSDHVRADPAPAARLLEDDRAEDRMTRWGKAGEATAQ